MPTDALYILHEFSPFSEHKHRDSREEGYASAPAELPLQSGARKEEFQRELFKVYVRTLVFNHLKSFLDGCRTYIHLRKTFWPSGLSKQLVKENNPSPSYLGSVILHLEPATRLLEFNIEENMSRAHQNLKEKYTLDTSTIHHGAESIWGKDMDNFVWGTHGPILSRSSSFLGGSEHCFLLLIQEVKLPIHNTSSFPRSIGFKLHWGLCLTLTKMTEYLLVPQLWGTSEMVGDMNCLLGADDEEP